MRTVKQSIVIVFSVFIYSYSQQFSLTVIPLKERYLVGEPIQVFISVRNIGIEESEGCFWGKMQLKLRNEKGENVQYSGPSGDTFSPCGRRIRPNEEVCNLIEVNMYFGKVFNLAYYDHYLDEGKYTLEVVLSPNQKEKIISLVEIVVGEPIGEEKMVYNSFWDITEGEVSGKYSALEIVQKLQMLHETNPNSAYSTIILTQLDAVYDISLKEHKKALLIRKELIDNYPSLRAWWMLGGKLDRMNSDLERVEYLTTVKSNVKDILVRKFYDQKIKELKR